MHPSEQPARSIFTVSKLNRLARTILESEIGQIWLSAEISNFVAAASGHWYFTLKDERAQIKAAMFRNANRRVTTRPKEGDKVLIRANISLYEPRGDYQLICEHIEPEGQGALKQQFEQLKIKLSAEGLFAQHHKQAIPVGATRVGVVTSSTGAALHDILTVLKRRNPAIQVTVYPTMVQGEQAPMSICQAIDTANRRNETDVLIVGRGGGSLEDLWCFNDEQVARSIFHSAIPVISAVGHEVDVTIADFVADLRAPTPSAAAELISQDQSELIILLQRQQSRLTQSLKHRLNELGYRNQVLTQRLQRNHPSTRLQQQSQYLDQLTASLKTAMLDTVYTQRTRLAALDKSLGMCAPSKQIARQQTNLQQYETALKHGISSLLKHSKQRIGSNTQMLNTVSPLATLSRGYNVAFSGDTIVRSVTEVNKGDSLRHLFKDGEVTTTVVDVAKKASQ